MSANSQEAHGGTLFLDEIGELPLDIQVKLLRALQDGEIDPIGAKRTVTRRLPPDLGHQPPADRPDQRRSFREDLYYRLNVFPIWVPPLRERMDDIPHLISISWCALPPKKANAIFAALAPALELLSGYDWPGNIRQLENAVFRAVVLCDGDQLTPAEFPQIAAREGLT
jgi:DNA-binding NtrC family response regulator